MGPFWPKSCKNKDFPQKMIMFNFTPLDCCNSMHNIWKVTCIDFCYTWKTSSWAPFSSKTSKQIYFQQTIWVIFKSLYRSNFMPTLDHYRGNSFSNPMSITVFLLLWPKGYQEPHNEVGSLSHAECLVEIKTGTFQL